MLLLEILEILEIFNTLKAKLFKKIIFTGFLNRKYFYIILVIY